jgi:hypothetical protein
MTSSNFKTDLQGSLLGESVTVERLTSAETDESGSKPVEIFIGVANCIMGGCYIYHACIDCEILRFRATHSVGKGTWGNTVSFPAMFGAEVLI